MTDEPIPCPFCGSEAEACTFDSDLVSCSNEGCLSWSILRPIAEWNTRPLESAMLAEIDQLRLLLRLRECSCGWIGREFSTVDYKHQTGARLCPECHEPTEIVDDDENEHPDDDDKNEYPEIVPINNYGNVKCCFNCQYHVDRFYEGDSTCGKYDYARVSPGARCDDFIWDKECNK